MSARKGSAQDDGGGGDGGGYCFAGVVKAEETAGLAGRVGRGGGGDVQDGVFFFAGGIHVEAFREVVHCRGGGGAESRRWRLSAE